MRPFSALFCLCGLLLVSLFDTVVGIPESLFLAPPLDSLRPLPRVENDEKWIVVTGAASGIGRALALRMAALGWEVLACDINEVGLTGIRGVERVHTVKLDVANPGSCAALAELVRRRCPEGLAALANVAGIMRPAALLGCSEQEINLTMSVNFAGPVRLMRLLLPSLLRGANGGTILNLTSTGGLDSWPWCGAYSSSKHALEGASDAVRREAIANGLPLRVVLVEPGPVDTPMARAQPSSGLAWCDANPASAFAPAMRRSCKAGSDAMKKWGFSPASFRLGFTPQQVAEVCAKALSTDSPRARYLACRGPFLWLLYMARMLPDEVGDQIMARV